MPSLEDILEESRVQQESRSVAPSKISLGGVDPLGLRQINFGLMDRVLPDLNNVARHVRPYIVMAWAWRRVRAIVEARKEKGAKDEEMRDFVDRIEAIYAWSQFLHDAKTDLPGRQAMQSLLSATEYRFGGSDWDARRDMRRYSTGLISPLNYGPSLRTLGWLISVEQGFGIFQPDPQLNPVLDEFESLIQNELEHDAFTKFGDVTVSQADAARWGALWAMDAVSEDEAEAMLLRLAGEQASRIRREGIGLMTTAYQDLGEAEPTPDALRMRMADLAPSWKDASVRPTIADSWRELQVRQLFRLTLEGLLFWTIGTLLQGPLRSNQIASMFLDECSSGCELPVTANEWLLAPPIAGNPVIFLRDIQSELQRRPRDPARLTAALLRGLAFSLSEAPTKAHPFEGADRLPLARARQDADSWKNLPPAEFLVRILERWIMAQHAYWSVGRGLADARSRGKRILRLRIVMDEGGWTLTSGTTKEGNPPQPTPDRLETAMSLLKECRRLDALVSRLP